MEPMKLETLQERAHNVILANPGITPDQRIKLLDIAFDKYRNSSATTPHRWEPDFSEGEPALDSKICGVCGKEHEESATNVRELAELVIGQSGKYFRNENTTWEEAVDRVAALIEASSLKGGATEICDCNSCRLARGAFPFLSRQNEICKRASSLRKVTAEMVKLAMLSATGNFPAEIAESINAQLAAQSSSLVTKEKS